jgi:hypothetical protein|nr:MAG TPA: hypothetical protein [Caudoviricetes sp.]
MSNDTYFTDEEYRLVLSALSREKKVCEDVDRKLGGECKLSILMRNVEDKIKYMQYHYN